MDDDNRLALESGGGGGAPFDGRELVAARRDIDAAIADADAMDNLLVTLIREEQRSNGRAVLGRSVKLPFGFWLSGSCGAVRTIPRRSRAAGWGRPSPAWSGGSSSGIRT